MFIEDGKGHGNNVEVNNTNQMAVVAEIHELQHHESVNNGRVYQAWGEVDAANGTVNVLYLENEDTDKEICISYMRIEAIDVAGLPQAGSYFQLGFDNTYTSGGDPVTPVNMNRGSANVANVSCYKNNPTLGGDFVEFDRWYPDGEGKMMIYNKHGSIIIPKNKSITIRFIHDAAVGKAYARITFFYIEN